MPVWLTLAAHFVLPGERFTPLKAIGLIHAYCGVAWAILDRDTGAAQSSLAGDLCALGAAIGWATLAQIARGTRLKEARPGMQLFWRKCQTVRSGNGAGLMARA